MFQLQDKSRFIRRPGPEPVRSAPAPRKKAEPKAPPPQARTLSTIVKEYKVTLAKLDDLEAELAEWLATPIADPAPKDGAPSPVEAAVRDEITQLSQPTPDEIR
jgi:hypothetical protein